MDGRPEVLIVGGGVAGLAVAGFLSRRGIRPTVVEKEPETGEVSWAIGLRSNGVAVLDQLGVADEALSRGSTTEELEVRASDRLLATVPVPDGSFLALSRNELVGILRRTVSDERIRTGTQPAGIEARGDCVAVALEDGTTNEYDAVVGADGVLSWVGAEMFDRRRVVERSTATWSFSLPPEADADFPDTLTSVLAPGAGAITDEVGGRCLVNLTAKTGGGITEGTVSEGLYEAAEEVGWRIPEYVDAVDDDDSLYFRRDYEAVAPSWGRGRVLLVGDAAHAVHPIAAMGATLALEDAYVLADEIEEGLRVEGALESFEERRRGRLRSVRRRARAEERFVFSESPLVTAPRRAVARWFPDAATRLGFLAAEFAEPSLDEL